MKKLFHSYLQNIPIAVTHMRARLKQTIIATMSVTLGISIFICLLGMILGTNRFTQDLILEQSPHLRFLNETQLQQQTMLDRIDSEAINILHHQKPKNALTKLKDAPQVISELRENLLVKAVAGSVHTEVFYNVGSVSVSGNLIGIDYENENRLFNLGNKVIAGSYKDLMSQPNTVVLGSMLAKRLNVNIGDNFQLVTPNGVPSQGKIVGLFTTGVVDIDNSRCYTSLKTAQRYMGVPSSYITDIKVNLHDEESAKTVAAELGNRYGYQYSDYMKDNAAMYDSQALNGIIVYAVGITMLLVAGFGIYNILNMMIRDKMKDIAILKAMGYSDSDVRSIFMAQALVIGLVGSILGLLLGYLILFIIASLPYHTENFPMVNHLPVSFDKSFFIMGFCFGMLTTAFAGYMPSRKAAKTDPVEILRG